MIDPVDRLFSFGGETVLRLISEISGEDGTQGMSAATIWAAGNYESTGD